MRFEKHLISENFVTNIFKKLIRKPANSAMKEIKNGFTDLIKFSNDLDEPAQKDLLKLINRAMGTSYRSVDDLSKAASKKIAESHELNEDFKHWWSVVKEQGWFNITFFPALQVWFEVANLLTSHLKGEALDQTTLKKIAFYGILWIALTSGKFIKDFFKWKKENPEEYSKERGKGTMSKKDIVRFA